MVYPVSGDEPAGEVTVTSIPIEVRQSTITVQVDLTT
jgi:hypothetical protein